MQPGPALRNPAWLARRGIDWGWLIAILLVLRNSVGNVFRNAATQLNNAPTTPYPGAIP